MVAPLVIAHRGASADAPENTLQAFQLALDQQADMIELDVRASADGVLVVFHDETTAHYAHPPRPIASLTASELARLDLGRGARIPTLAEVCVWASGVAIALNIELKVAGIEAAVIELVRRYGLSDRVIVSSFLEQVVLTLATQAPDLARACLTDLEVGPGEHQIGESPLDILARAAAYAWHPSWQQLRGPEQVAEVQGAGYRVFVWTIDDEAEMQRLLAWGVNGIITNRPAILHNLLTTM